MQHPRIALKNKYYNFLMEEHTFHQIWNMAVFKVTRAFCPHIVMLKYHPIILNFRITLKCNQKCNFCIRRAPSVHPESHEFTDMSFEDFIKIIERFKEAIILNLSGGEPLLHKDFFRMVKYAYVKKVNVKTFTNGTLLHKKIEGILKSPLSTINISLDAHNPFDYERMHGGSKRVFYTVLDNITELAEQRQKFNSTLRLVVSYICTKKNYKKIPDMIHLAEELELDELHLRNLMPFGLPGFSKDQCLYEDDLDVIEVIESVETSSVNLRVRIPHLLKRVITKRSCRMPFTDLTIEGDGHYHVCCQTTSHAEFGNVYNNGDVWNSVDFQRIRQVLINDFTPLPELCRVCPNLARNRLNKTSRKNVINIEPFF